MKILSALALVVLVALPADAATWKSRRVTVVDYTGWAEVREAAERWDAATVVKLPFKTGNPASAPTICPPAGCAPVTGVVSVVIANLGPHQFFAATRVSYDGAGNISGATITVNSYLNPQVFPDNWQRFWLLNQLGIALAELPIVCRIGSVMSGCQDGTGSPGLPQYPDAGDIDAMNAAYGR